MLGTEMLAVPLTDDAATAYDLPREGRPVVVTYFWSRRHVHREIELRPLPKADVAADLPIPTLPSAADDDGAPTTNQRPNRRGRTDG